MATWIPSDTANIHLVDTDKDLDGAQDGEQSSLTPASTPARQLSSSSVVLHPADISRASIIAIDCEWSPTASQHGKAQRALLIQLAMRIPGRCDTCHVLDMIALPRRRVSNILTSAFRREVSPLLLPSSACMRNESRGSMSFTTHVSSALEPAECPEAGLPDPD